MKHKSNESCKIAHIIGLNQYSVINHAKDQGTLQKALKPVQLRKK